MGVDDFKQLKLIASTNARSATVDGIVDLYYGDSIKLYVKNLPKADVDTLRADLYSKPNAAGILAQCLPESFAAVAGKPHDFYATLTLFTDEIKDYLEDAEAGEPLLTQLVISDTNGVWVDITLDLYPNPQLDGEIPPPIVSDPYIRESDLESALSDYLLTEDSIDKADLNTDLLAVQALPTLTAAEREARFNALLTALITATS